MTRERNCRSLDKLHHQQLGCSWRVWIVGGRIRLGVLKRARGAQHTRGQTVENFRVGRLAWEDA